jgi:hemerythrin
MAQDVPILGVAEMDSEHKALHALLATVADTPDDGLEDLLFRARRETAAHFAHEERLMEDARFPVLFCHRAQHRRLLAEFETARQLLETFDPAALRHRLAVVIPTMIEAHIASVDRVTAGFLKGELTADDFAGFTLPRLPVPA